MVSTAFELKAALDQKLSALATRGTRAALINYPNHHNVGDRALYVGTLMTLKRIGVRVTYRCDHLTYSRSELGAELDRGTSMILINGGGNLGDQYPQQVVREQVLSELPDVRTIQLPQSLWFVSEANHERFGELVARHRDLIMLFRDQSSYETAVRTLDARSVLCPDMAFGLGPLTRPVAASQDVLWLQRTDSESASPGSARFTADGVEPVDWLDASPEQAVGYGEGVWLLHANRLLTRWTIRRPWLWPQLARTFEPLAQRRLLFGCRLLAMGRVVVTDRLHGVVIAFLMGIPVIAVDTTNHKVSSFINTWLRGAPGVRLAHSHEEALLQARRLLQMRLAARGRPPK